MKIEVGFGGRKIHYAQIIYGKSGALCPCGVGGRATSYTYTSDSESVTCGRCKKWLKHSQQGNAQQRAHDGTERQPKEKS
jgi:hypothetical protein